MKTRQKILNEAFSLIAKKGYDNTSTKEICEAAGIKKPTLYYHFKSKEDLYLQLIETFISGERAIIFDLNVTKDEYFTSLIEFGELFIESYKATPDFGGFVMELYLQSRHVSQISFALETMNSRFKNDLSKIVERGEVLKLLSQANHDINCDQIFTTIHGIEFSLLSGTDINHLQVWKKTISCLV